LRHEIIDGIHYVNCVGPTWRHQQPSGAGCSYAIVKRPLRVACLIGLPVFLSPFDVVCHEMGCRRSPNICCLYPALSGTYSDQAERQGAPDLVVEIFSPSTQRRDEQIKLATVRAECRRPRVLGWSIRSQRCHWLADGMTLAS
jgi:hypothetical protein